MHGLNPVFEGGFWAVLREELSIAETMEDGVVDAVVSAVVDAVVDAVAVG